VTLPKGQEHLAEHKSFTKFSLSLMTLALAVAGLVKQVTQSDGLI
jgi:hypothetical protein